MKFIFTFLLPLFAMSGLKSQTTTSKFLNSIEISTEFRNVHANNDPLESYCCDISYRLIRKSGYEYGLNVGLNKSISDKQNLLYGIGLTQWKFTADEINDWYDYYLPNRSISMGLINLNFGHRYHVFQKENKSIFYQTLIHGEINTSGPFSRYRLSIEPGVGVLYNRDNRLNIFGIISYKQSLFDIYKPAGVFPKSIGARIGISVDLCVK